MNIAQKFLLTILVTSLLPLIGIGIITFLTTQQALNDQIQSRIDNTNKHHLDRLNTINARTKIQLNNTRYKAQVRLLLQEYISNPSTAIQSQINQALQDILAQEDTFHQIHVLSNTGEVVASTDPTTIGKDFSKTEVFKTGSQTSTVNNFFKNSANELDQYLAAPLELGGQKLGVVLIEATAAPYLVVAKDYSELGLTGESYLTRKTNTGEKQYLTPLRFNQHAALTTDIMKNLTQDYRQHEILSSSQAVPDTDWTLITKIDRDELNAPVIQLGQLLLFILIITALIAIFFAWYLSGFMTAPVKRLTQAVANISGGDLTQRVPVESNDEVGSLGAAFNQMTTKLSDAYKNLEQKVVERTGQLNLKVQEIEKMNKYMVGREMKMIEQKKEIEQLKSELDKVRPPLFSVNSPTDTKETKS